MELTAIFLSEAGVSLTLVCLLLAYGLQPIAWQALKISTLVGSLSLCSFRRLFLLH